MGVLSPDTSVITAAVTVSFSQFYTVSWKLF